MILYPLFWNGITPPNNEHSIGSRRQSQNKKSHGLKQGDPWPNYNPNPSPLTEEATQAEKSTLTPKKLPTTQTQNILSHNPVNVTILTGTYGPKQGNPSTPSLSEHLQPHKIPPKLPLSAIPNHFSLLYSQNPLGLTKIKAGGYPNET